MLSKRSSQLFGVSDQLPMAVSRLPREFCQPPFTAATTTQHRKMKLLRFCTILCQLMSECSLVTREYPCMTNVFQIDIDQRVNQVWGCFLASHGQRRGPFHPGSPRCKLSLVTQSSLNLFWCRNVSHCQNQWASQLIRDLNCQEKKIRMKIPTRQNLWKKEQCVWIST